MKSKALLIVLVTSLIPFLFYFHSSDLPHTHDGLVHLPRIAAYYKALSDGVFPVRFATELNYGYGLPLFNFIYPLPYLIASFFVFLGFGLVDSFKITLCLSFFFSGIFMYLFSKEFFKEEKKALIITLLYQFASFRFIELLLRGSFGEVYTYTFLPLVLYGLVKISEKNHSRSVILTAVATSFLILSHNSISLVFFGVAVLFAIFFLNGIKKKIVGFLSLSLGMLLSSFYWIPAIVEHKYTYGDLFMESLYKSHFPPFWYFFFPNITNSSAFQIEQIAVQVGFFQMLALLLLIVDFITTKKILYKKVALFCWIMFLGALFFMQPISIFFWEHISFLRQFQFPWRLLSVVVFASSFAGVSYFAFTFFRSSKIVYVLSFLIICSSIFYWFPRLGYDTIDEQKYWNFPLTTTYYGETDVIWSEGPAKKYPKAKIEVIEGKATISNLTQKTNQHEFIVEASKAAKLVSRTQYFPGWNVYVDSVSVPIEFQDPHYRGQLTFQIPQGKHAVLIRFEENKLRALADGLSITGVVLLILLAVFPKHIYEKK